MPNGEFSPEKNKELQIELKAKEILKDFDLEMEDLKGKNVLDIGAGSAELARYANKKGTNVVSLEKFIEEQSKQFLREGAKYVEAEVEALPFREESFDLLMSHGGPPIISAKKEEIEKIIKEGYRVLKNGGEWRVGMGYLSAEAFEDLNLPDDMNRKERMKKIREASLDFLSDIWQGKVKEVQKGKELNEMYYVLIKKEENGQRLL